MNELPEVPATEEEEAYIAENLMRLLENDDSTNVTLGLQLLKGIHSLGAVEKALIVFAKVHPDNDVRSTVRKIWERKGRQEIQDLMKNTITFLGINRPDGMTERDIRDKMAKMGKTVSWENMNYFCHIFFDRFGKGLSYLFTYPEYNPYRQGAFARLTKDGLFDYHKGLGYSDRRDRDFEGRSQHKIKITVRFPKDHPAPLEVRKINFHNCKLHVIPADIKIFENLEELDLSCNFLSNLPPAIGNMKKLKRLDISSNYFEEFPKALLKIKGLEYLAIHYNYHQKTISNPLSVPDEFYKNNPNCEVIKD